MVIMNKIKKIAILILTLIMILGISACGKVEEPVTAPVIPAPIKENSVEAFGIVKTTDIHNVNVGFTASVSSVEVREGQQIKKGDILMTLDIKDYMTQIDAKQHELNVISLEISKLQSKLIEADASKSKDPDVKKLVNDIEYAKQMYQSALKESEDKDELYQSGVISKYELDEFVKIVDDKKKTIDDLSYSLDITMNNKQIGNKELKDNISIQRERAVALEREIADMKGKLNKAYMKGEEIIADVENGVVFDLGYIKGDIVSPSQKVLSIMNLDGMIVRANVSEEFIKDVKIGQKVEIIPVADKSKKYNGTVKMISSRGEVQNGETVIPVEIIIDNNDGFLMPEYNVDVEIFY
jgi:multidrug resistance efflux pump